MSLKRTHASAAALLVVAAGLVACNPNSHPPVEEFLASAHNTMLRLGTESGQAAWVYSTYITQDTEALNAKANQAYIAAVARLAKEAARYDDAS